MPYHNQVTASLNRQGIAVLRRWSEKGRTIHSSKPNSSLRRKAAGRRTPGDLRVRGQVSEYGVTDEHNELAAGSSEGHVEAWGVEDELGFGDDEVAVGDGVAGDSKVPLLSLEPVDGVHEGQVGHIPAVVSSMLCTKPSE